MIDAIRNLRRRGRRSFMRLSQISEVQSDLEEDLSQYARPIKFVAAPLIPDAQALNEIG